MYHNLPLIGHQEILKADSHNRNSSHFSTEFLHYSKFLLWHAAIMEVK